jgi:hypothetical protein
MIETGSIDLSDDFQMVIVAGGRESVLPTSSVDFDPNVVSSVHLVRQLDDDQ